MCCLDACILENKIMIKKNVCIIFIIWYGTPQACGTNKLVCISDSVVVVWSICHIMHTEMQLDHSKPFTKLSHDWEMTKYSMRKISLICRILFAGYILLNKSYTKEKHWQSVHPLHSYAIEIDLCQTIVFNTSKSISRRIARKKV